MSEQKQPTKQRNPRKIALIVLVVALIAAGLCIFLAITKAQDDEAVHANTTATTANTSADNQNPDGTYNVDRSEHDARFQEYLDNSTVNSQEVASESKNVLTEAEAVAAFNERGFDGASATTEYSIAGNYIGETAVSTSSSTKHPFYTVTYKSAEGITWAISCYGNTFSAVAMDDSLYFKNGVPACYSENESTCIYKSGNNTLYNLIPPRDEVAIIPIDRIDAATLDTIR